ncbi:MAG: NAD(+) synthase [Bacteroidia bacterium]|nr:NAD(+) synthase [Bacteroidia bacterium]
MSKTLKIGGATVNQTPMDWGGNVVNIIDALESAKSQKIDILCFPELCLSGYGCEDMFLSDWLSESAWNHLQTIVPYCDAITACIGLPIRMDGITYNGVCVITNKKIAGITLKQNMARDGVHYEPRWFDAWPVNMVKELSRGGQIIQTGDLVYETKGIKFGFEICEDAWRKSKRPGYQLRERGVDLILNPSASHFALAKSELREEEVVVEGSKKFKCAYVFANLLGNEAGRMIYDGDIIIGQNGNILGVNQRLSFKNFNLLACEIDFENPSNSKVTPSSDSKEKNEEFARATSLALFDYLRKSKAKGFVLSLSGGADSACCAILVAEMVRRASSELGWEKFCLTLGLPPLTSSKDAMANLLTCAYQGTKNSTETTQSAARGLAQSLGSEFHKWMVDEEVNSYQTKIEKVLNRSLTWKQDDIALQNIQARTRSPIIWMLANIKQSLLLTTSNRSEGDVGYATMDGDTSGSLAPIAGIDKPFIMQWLKWAETELGYTGLASVNNLQPTAELRPSDLEQTDEKDLMPYLILVAIEKLAIRDRKSPMEVYQILAEDVVTHHGITQIILKEYVKKFYRMWSANQWKRERIAPSFHLDDMNVDPRSWCRFPILSSGFKKELEELDEV